MISLKKTPRKLFISVTMRKKSKMASPKVAVITILNCLPVKMQNSLLLHFQDL